MTIHLGYEVGTKKQKSIGEFLVNETESNPLKWPDGWERTRIQDRKGNGGWKKTFKGYREGLIKEMGRMGVTEIMISYNIAPSDRMDCGVAVYFSKQINEDYSWQDALGLLTPAPTLAEIDSAYRKLAVKVHPDGPAPDVPVFQALTKHRDNARNWVKGTMRHEHEYVIACDRFSETRLNLAAIRLAIAALRQLDRVGVSSILERTFRGFKTALPAYAGKEAAGGTASS
jgi:hypothetical protein